LQTKLYAKVCIEHAFLFLSNIRSVFYNQLLPDERQTMLKGSPLFASDEEQLFAQTRFCKRKKFLIQVGMTMTIS